jgi:dynein heavy chain
MYSGEDEFVQYQTIVDTASARGQVDEWLIQVESAMIESIKHVTENSYTEYQKYPRIEWVLGRCGMTVLCMSMTYWTYEAELNINESGAEGAKKFAT